VEEGRDYFDDAAHKFQVPQSPRFALDFGANYFLLRSTGAIALISRVPNAAAAEAQLFQYGP
jgi:hypothetical protein